VLPRHYQQPALCTAYLTERLSDLFWMCLICNKIEVFNETLLFVSSLSKAYETKILFERSLFRSQSSSQRIEEWKKWQYTEGHPETEIEVTSDTSRASNVPQTMDTVQHSFRMINQRLSQTFRESVPVLNLWVWIQYRTLFGSILMAHNSLCWISRSFVPASLSNCCINLSCNHLALTSHDKVRNLIIPAQTSYVLRGGT
jgi:hypothetical protein